ncbi:MAG: VWA domain-containing protein [Planctomycetota bacterium]|nr:VWA domain-containing protein [Planctomycetota bacterium]
MSHANRSLPASTLCTLLGWGSGALGAAIVITSRLKQASFPCLLLFPLLCGVVDDVAASMVSDISKARVQLASAIQQDRFDEASRAVDVLIIDGSKKAIEAVVQVGLGGNSYAIERYIGSKLVGLKPGPGFDRVCQLATKDKRVSARIILTLVLSVRPERDAYTAVLTNLYDSEDSVALTAIEALAKKDDLGAVDHLIEALARQEKVGRRGTLVAYEIRKCLLKLVGEDFRVAADWENFWAPRKKDYVRPDPSERKQGLTSVRRDPPAFFGMEVAAKNVLFLLDVSGSMEVIDDLPENPGDAAGGGGGTGVNNPDGSPKPTPAQQESRQRIRRVQNELIRTIEKLPDDVRFNIITFNHEIHAMSKNLVVASSRRKKEAIQYVRKFDAQGETWTDHALRKAFGSANLKAIFLLSDGAPRRDNKLLDTVPILRWVREANRFRRIRVNTIGFEQAGRKLRTFMRSLAIQNNGQYIELR